MICKHIKGEIRQALIDIYGTDFIDKHYPEPPKDKYISSDVFKGDIVTIVRDVYIDYPGGRWCDHFSPKLMHYKVVDNTNSNNGYFKAKDSHGKKWLCHVDEVIKVYRKEA